ncbi:MAG: XdhC family protein [Halopseudomonas sp.]|uniref:XdhC family protein n=1 Tax=Halopseudomonas sp. TaxID=2901191 RepID=UPI0030027701
MAELAHLLKAVTMAQSEGEDAVLATVVKVEGSAYRRPGARMLITALGQTQGTLSGGCLESEVARTAFWLTEQGPALRSYSTAEDEEDGDAAVSFGLGCNGTVHILFERISAPVTGLLLDGLRALQADDQPRAVATLLSPEAVLGQRLLLASNGALEGEVPAPLQAAVAAVLQQALEQERSSLHGFSRQGGHAEVLVEYLSPVRRLVIFGGGHDAQPLARMAKQLGWRVTVVDSRAHFARESRFPEADDVLLGRLDDSFDPLPLLQGAAVAVMTHSLQQDAHWLGCALRSQAAYIGQLGPRERTERLLRGMPAAVEIEQYKRRLHYPMGLDLGGDTPETVAMAVLAEVTAVLNAREGGMLKHRAAAIHDMAPTHFHSADAPAQRPIPSDSRRFDR